MCFMTASTSAGEGEPSDPLSAVTDESGQVQGGSHNITVSEKYIHCSSW